MLLDSTDDAVICECRSKVLKFDQSSKMFEIYSTYIASSVLSHKAFKKQVLFIDLVFFYRSIETLQQMLPPPASR